MDELGAKIMIVRLFSSLMEFDTLTEEYLIKSSTSSYANMCSIKGPSWEKIGGMQGS